MVGNLSTIMHPDDYQNWLTIKETFEENGTTDNYYYKRACVIVRGEPDPMSNIPNVSQDEWNKTCTSCHKRGVSGND